MAQDLVKLEVSSEVVRPIVEAQIRAAIVAAMSDNPQRLIDAMVTEALNYKVASDGKVSNYSNENKFSWLSVHLRQVLHEETKRALNEMMLEIRDKLKDSIKRELKKDCSTTKLAAAIVSGITENVACKYNSQIEVRFAAKSE